ncbi:MAG TPA: RNA polymerase sigma factor region1.1 domain-containing protein, partial [Acidimicrobiales bacterium]|nr:RNA polymerase sigma factor region1.1 domain-containing protein [Acidimicrobiales bacterium]
MTEAASARTPWGVSERDLHVLVLRGRRTGVLTMDDVVLVLQTVELTAEVIEGVRTHLLEAGVVLDESLPPVDLPDDELVAFEPEPEPGHRPPPSVEAELHEAADEHGRLAQPWQRAHHVPQGVEPVGPVAEVGLPGGVDAGHQG